MIQPGRKYSATDGYRYGFNGKENDNDVKGEGLQLDYGFRIYDTRLGRFLSVDPLQVHYPELTPYQFASNRPIEAVDLDGREAKDLYMELEPVRNQRERERRLGITYPESRGEKIIKNVIFFSGVVFAVALAPITWEIVATMPASVAVAATNTVIWASNPVNQAAIGSAVGFAFELLNPDPNGAPVNFPGEGDEFGRAVKWLFKNKAGKTVEFIAEEGSKFANQSEFTWVGRLLDEGNNVKLLKESTQEGVQTADLLVNGIMTEIKEISNITSTKLGDRIKETIEAAVKQAGSKGNVIIDVTKQKGATKELLQQTIERVKGNAKESFNYRVVGQGFELGGSIEKKKS